MTITVFVSVKLLRKKWEAHEKEVAALLCRPAQYQRDLYVQINVPSDQVTFTVADNMVRIPMPEVANFEKQNKE